MSSTHWEDFYATHLPPNCFEDNRSLLKEFCDRHFKLKSNIVLVTVIDLDREGSIEKGSRIKKGWDRRGDGSIRKAKGVKWLSDLLESFGKTK